MKGQCYYAVNVSLAVILSSNTVLCLFEFLSYTSEC